MPNSLGHMYWERFCQAPAPPMVHPILLICKPGMPCAAPIAPKGLCSQRRTSPPRLPASSSSHYAAAFLYTCSEWPSRMACGQPSTYPSIHACMHARTRSSAHPSMHACMPPHTLGNTQTHVRASACWPSYGRMPGRERVIATPRASVERGPARHASTGVRQAHLEVACAHHIARSHEEVVTEPIDIRAHLRCKRKPRDRFEGARTQRWVLPLPL